jgi:MerR family transcriptional regulator, light-induced transcriptional regulator
MATHQPSPNGPGDHLRERQAALAEDLVNRQFAARPELAQRYGPAGREKCLQDANYHLAYLASAMNAGDPSLFANYVAWVKVMLGKRGIPAEDLARHLELTRTVVGESVGGEAGALAVEYLSAGLARLPSLPTDLSSYLVNGAPHVELARAYLGALLNGERHDASRMVLDAVSSGVPVKDVYLHVFQPAQYEIGRLWQINEISVAQEHYGTAATQLVMSQLYPHVFASEKGAGTLVATCVAGDLHEIGGRMVSDFFEIEGWNTFYLGANMPPQAVLDTVVQRRAQVLGISVTMLFHLPAIDELIRKVRAHSECRGVKILVGGCPFLAAPDLWRSLGADGSAPNAQEATILASRLIA